MYSVVLLLGLVSIAAAVTQYVDSSTVVTGSMSGSGKNNIKDNKGNTQFTASGSLVDKDIQLDFGSSKTVKSFYIDQKQIFSATYAKLDVYIGETPNTGSYTSLNTKCCSGCWWRGISNCDGTGRYMQFRMANSDAHPTFYIADILVFDQEDKSSSGTLKISGPPGAAYSNTLWKTLLKGSDKN